MGSLMWSDNNQVIPDNAKPSYWTVTFSQVQLLLIYSSNNRNINQIVPVTRTKDKKEIQNSAADQESALH